MTADHALDERQADRGRHARKRWWLRDNWYRDVWLLVISLVAAATCIIAILEPGRRADEIQASRYEATRAQCLDQNDRNTIAVALAEKLDNPDVVIGLINAIIPYRDNCAARAKSIITPPG